MYLSSYHDICDIYHQNSMTEINSFDIYSWHKQLTYDTCQEIILPTTWKKLPSCWTTPEIILLNDLKTHQKWGLAFPMPLITSHLEGSSTSVSRPGYCHSPDIAVKNDDVRQPILLDVSSNCVHIYLNFGLPLGLTPSTSMSRTVRNKCIIIIMMKDLVCCRTHCGDHCQHGEELSGDAETASTQQVCRRWPREGNVHWPHHRFISEKLIKD